MPGKTCSKCGARLPHSKFYKDTRPYSKDGLRAACKKCTLNDCEKYYRSNRDKVIDRTSAYQKKNRHAARASSSKWQKNNPEKMAAHCAARRARKLKATPPWYERDPVAQIYSLCRMLTRLWGIKYEVDHRIGLKSQLASGLHCYDNLLPIPKEENIRKSNRFDPDEHVHFLP